MHPLVKKLTDYRRLRRNRLRKGWIACGLCAIAAAPLALVLLRFLPS